MADNKNINIDIKNAIHQQASKQATSSGLKNQMQPKGQSIQNSGLKDVITQFSEVKKLLAQTNENSKNTFSKLQKNINSLIEIEKQNATTLSAISTNLSKTPQAKQPDKIEYDQQKFIEQLKVFFDQLNTKLLLIKEDINSSNSTQQNIDLSSIENSISSSSDSITNKLNEFIQNLNTNQAILTEIKQISNQITNNQNTNINDNVITILQKISQTLAAKSDQSEILAKLDLLIQNITQYNEQKPSDINENHITKEDLDTYLTDIINVLQKKNQNLSYTTVLDISKLEQSFNIFLQNLKNQNTQLAQKLIEQKANITSSPNLSEYSPFDLQVLTSVQQKLQAITLSIEEFKNNYNNNNNNLQATQQQLSIALTLAKLDQPASSISKTDIQNLSKSINALVESNSTIQNVTQNNNVENKPSNTTQSTNASNTSTTIIKKNIIKNSNQLAPSLNDSSEQQTKSNSIAEFGQTLKTEFFNLLSNINLFNQNNETKKTQKKESKTIVKKQLKKQLEKQPDQKNQIPQPNENEQPNENAEADIPSNEITPNDESIANLNEEIQATLEMQQPTTQPQPQMEATILNNLSAYQNNSDLFSSDTQNVSQNEEISDGSGLITAVSQTEQAAESTQNDIIYDIKDTLASIQKNTEAIMSSNNEIPIITITSNMISQITQALSNINKTQTSDNNQFNIPDINVTVNVQPNIIQKPVQTAPKNTVQPITKQTITIQQVSNTNIQEKIIQSPPVVTTNNNQADSNKRTAIQSTPSANVVQPTNQQVNQPQNNTAAPSSPNVAQPANTQVSQPQNDTVAPSGTATVQPNIQTKNDKPTLTTQISTNKPDKKTTAENTNPLFDLPSQIMDSIFGANILQSSGTKNKQTSQNSLFGGLFNRKPELSESKQQAVQQIDVKQTQLKSMSTQVAKNNLQLAKVSDQISVQSKQLDSMLDGLDDVLEERELLDLDEFIQLCKSQQLKDIIKAIEMCDKQLERLNQLKNTAKDKDSIILQQKNVNEVKKQLLIQKSNIEKKIKHETKSKQLQQKINETELTINKIKTDNQLTDEQIKIGLNKEQPSQPENVMSLIVNAFAELLGIETGNSKEINLTPEKIQNESKQPQKSQKQLIDAAFKKYTSIDSGNPVIDGYLNSYVNKRLADIREKNPDLSSKEITNIGNSLIKQFETAWNNDQVLIPTKDGSTYSQYPKSKIKELQTSKQPLVLQDINVKNAIDDDIESTLEDEVQTVDVSTTDAQPNKNQSATSDESLQLEDQPDQIYINQGQYDQDMSAYMLEQLQYEKNKQKQQLELQQWKTTGSDEISNLFADTKNNYVSSEVQKTIESNNVSPQDQQKLIETYKLAWDNNFKNDVIIYIENESVFKANKDEFLQRYFITNKSVELKPPTMPQQSDYIVTNPSEQQKSTMILQPYTQKDEGGNVLDKNGQIVEKPPKIQTLPEKKDDKDTVSNQLSTKLQKKDSKKEKPEPPYKPTAVTAALMTGGNVAEAYRKQKQQQKLVQHKIADNMLGNYSKMLGIDAKQLADIFNTEQAKQADNKPETPASNISNNASTTSNTSNILNNTIKNLNNPSSVVSSVTNNAAGSLSNLASSTVSNVTNSATKVLKQPLSMVKATTNPISDGISNVKKLVETEKQQSKKQTVQKSTAAQNMQSLITTMTSTIFNNTSTQPKQQNSDKLLQGIATLIEASKPQVIYIWPSQSNDPARINTFVNI